MRLSVGLGGESVAVRVVVTGATGNVGTTVVRALTADGSDHEVIGIARRPPRDRLLGATYHAADVGTDDLTPFMAGADAVIHLAWLFQPTHSPTVTWRANAVGTARVLLAAAEAGVSTVVHASSVAAYSPVSDDEPRTEPWPTHSLPTAGYGREKAYAERLLDTFAAEHPRIRTVRLRPGFIFQRDAATAQRRIFLGPFVPASIIGRRQLPPVLPLPKGLRFQALHADDMAEAYRLAVTSDVSGAFNIAADPVLDIAALAGILEVRAVPVAPGFFRAALAAAWKVHLVPAEPALFDLVMGIPVLDTSRARTELGWQPRWSGDDAVREALAGFAHGAGGPTEALAPDDVGERLREVMTGVGEVP